MNIENTRLTKKEKEVIGLLSFGTFLEYFDFFLYIHLATLLNSVFFGQSDPSSSALLTSIAYCTSYIFRPVGALLFGYIGDKYGRKVTINLSLLLMGVSCLGIFFLPSYEQIGVAASVFITLFRILQSVTTMSEIVGGEIYLIEFIKGRKTFLALGLLGIGCFLGGQTALHCVDFVMRGVFDWRYLFLAGLSIFVLRSYAMRHLDEPLEYREAKLAQRANVKLTLWEAFKDHVLIYKADKTQLAVYFSNTMQPITWFTCCVGLNSILKSEYGYTDVQIVTNNVFIFYVYFASLLFVTVLGQYIEPLRIIRVKSIINSLLFLCSPIILTFAYNDVDIIAFQCALLFFGLSDFNIMPYIYKAIPTIKRFRLGAMSFAVSRAVVSVLTSFGIVLLEPYTGVYTYLLLCAPFTIGYIFAIKHFTELDKKNSNGYHVYYNESSSKNGSL